MRPGDAVEFWTGPQVAWIPRTEEEGQWPLHASPAWREIARWSEHLVRVLSRGPWARRSCPVGATDSKKPETPVGAPHHRAAETLLALQVAFSVRFALVRLMSVFALAVVGLLLLLCAHLFYAFQSRIFWLGVDWVLIGAATAIVVFFLVRLEKSTLLSFLWGSEPGVLELEGPAGPPHPVVRRDPGDHALRDLLPGGGRRALLGGSEPVQKSLP